MNDSTNDSTNHSPASAASGKPASTVAPPTPVVLVWPGRAFPQVWIFLWIGVAFLMSGLLPWGSGGARRDAQAFNTAAFGRYDAGEPMTLARCIVVLAAVGMILACARGVWNRDFKLTAVLLGGLAVLVELLLAKAVEHVSALAADLGGLFDGAKRGALEAVYAERGPGYYLALIGALIWSAVVVASLVAGFMHSKARTTKAAKAAVARPEERRGAADRS